MPPNHEFSNSSSSSSLIVEAAPSSPSVFSVEAIVRRYRETALPTELQTLAAQATQDITSFLATTPTTLQLTSFGPTGLVTLDLLARSGLLASIPVLFIDTLHHFQETYDLIANIKARYPALRLHIYKPKGMETREQFEEKFGQNLWEKAPSKFGYYTKVEPRDRAMAELGATAYLNGRRKGQGDQRVTLSLVDEDPEMNITRVQPLVNWSFPQVWAYLIEYNVPYNALHDQGFKSVGDVMTSAAVGQEEDERAGRWKGSHQSECGLHLTPKQLALLGIDTTTTDAATTTTATATELTTLVTVGGH